jgi:hypothetical protein
MVKRLAVIALGVGLLLPVIGQTAGLAATNAIPACPNTPDLHPTKPTTFPTSGTAPTCIDANMKVVEGVAGNRV